MDLIEGLGGAAGFGNYPDIYDQGHGGFDLQYPEEYKQQTNLLGQRRNFSLMEQNQGYDEPDRNQIAYEDIEDIEEVYNNNK